MSEIDFIQELNRNGCNVYVVGGFVRDNLMKIIHNYEFEPKDVDLCVTDKSLDEIGIILEKYGKVKKVGKSFGIITFKCLNLNPKFEKFKEFDIAVPRKERSTGSGYRDFDIEHGEHIPLEEDLIRRDFTINAMAYKLNCVNDLDFSNFNKEKLVDISDGFEHLKQKIVKAVGNPYDRFKEDGTRILRGLRQSAKLNFSMEEETFKSCSHNLNFLESILEDSPVRVTNELIKLLKTNNIKLLYDSGVHKLFNLIDYEYLKRDNKLYESMDVAGKLYLLLKHDNLKKWIKKYDLTACPDFSSEQVVLLKRIDMGYHLLDLTFAKLQPSDKINHNLSIIAGKFLKAIDDNRLYENQIKNYNKDEFYMKQSMFGELIKVMRFYYDDSPNFNSLIECVIKKYNMPRTENQLSIGGDMLKIKYNLEGRQIGYVKKALLEDILNEKSGWKIAEQESRIDEIVKSKFSS